jgi:hypothetical protein
MKPSMKPRSSIDFAWCKPLAAVAVLCGLPGWARAAELHVPATAKAGQSFSLPTAGSGQATFYLLGPDHVVKRTVNLGSDVPIQSSDVRSAGLYQAILCDASCSSATFEVKAAEPAHLSFFLHPSRVPVSSPDAIDATAFVFDQYFNLVLSPAVVDFRVTPASGAGFARHGPTHRGVTWMRMDSTPHEGTVQVTAVACGLRMKAVTSGNRVTVETDPVRDCSGNALPDGTVVSFTKLDKAGKSTVDTPIKKGVARMQFSVHGPAQISVACGVVLGNEVALGGRL